MPDAAHFEKQIQDLKREKEELRAHYEKKIEELTLTLDKALAATAVEDVAELQKTFSSPDVAQTLTDADVNLDSNTQVSRKHVSYWSQLTACRRNGFFRS